MSYGFNKPALFRAHNTLTQLYIPPNNPFVVDVTEGCDVNNNRVGVINSAYVYGDVKIDASRGLQTYDMSFNPAHLNSSIVPQGWQISSDIGLSIMTGDDAVYGVANQDVSLIVRDVISGYSGNSSAEQTRICGFRVEN